jgi:arginine decarboxylase
MPKYSLLERLEAHAALGARAMHMPGHKRNTAAAHYLSALGARLDITEIDGFDSLHAPQGILKSSMERAARVWGSQSAFFLVNGSTCGILAGIRAALSPGQKVIAARNCHQAVFHAIDVAGLDAKYILPAFDEDLGIFLSVTPESVASALDQDPDAGLIVVTSPTYEGVISDIAGICRAAHRRGVPVLVDEAHGAHLGFSPKFPGGAVSAGADIVIQSLHKTLPSLTQTAIAHVGGGRISADALQAQIGIFETSSPSYLLLASIDGCVRLIEREKSALFDRWAAGLEGFFGAVRGLERLRVMGAGPRPPGAFMLDPSKIMLSARGAMTGLEMAGALRARGIEPEMAACDYVLLMTGLTEPDGALEALAEVIWGIDRTCPKAPGREKYAAPRIPQRAMTIARALREQADSIPFEAAEGRISAQYLWAYPPGIPLIAPGERIEAHLLSERARMLRAGILPIGGRDAGRIDVVKARGAWPGLRDEGPIPRG